MWNAKTRRRKERGVFSAKVALAEVMGGVFLRGLPSFLRGLLSFPRRPPSFPRGLPSFPRRRESGWYGRECESVGYDVSIPARASRHSCAGLPSFLRAASRHSRVGGNLGGMEGSARVWGMVWVFLGGLPSFLGGLPSFLGGLPSFLRDPCHSCATLVIPARSPVIPA